MLQSSLSRCFLSTTRSTVFKNTTASSNRFISSAQLTINPAVGEANIPQNKKELQFGRVFSSHMLQIPYNGGSGGWQSPEIVPFHDLKISPAASSLHYGLQCFEGMKAYKSVNNSNDIRLFRPQLNMKRLSNSMNRLCMPGSDFDHQELIDCIAKLVRLDQDWIPTEEGYSLYIRPTVISTHSYLGVAAPEDILLYVITCPVGPYYKSGFAPIRLTADTPYVRAWPGGTGAAKVGGNYAGSMLPATHAFERGYSQILWLFGEEEEITEVGAMNVFFFLEKEDGSNRRELVTPPLTRGDILPGVTRQSIIDLSKSWGEFDVVERSITLPEVRKAASEGRLIEAFGAGTAAVVTPISAIEHKGSDIEIPATGDLTQRLFSDIMGIQYGRIDGPEGWSVKI